MATYDVYAVYTASKYLGKVVADSEEEAKEKAEEMDAYVSLCCHCSGKIELNGDPDKFEAEKVE